MRRENVRCQGWYHETAHARENGKNVTSKILKNRKKRKKDICLNMRGGNAYHATQLSVK